MKRNKLLPAVLMTLALLLCLSRAASADQIYSAPTGVVAGSYLDHLVVTVESGAAVSVLAAPMPTGLDFVTETDANGVVYVYLRGTPLTAGSFDCALSIGDTPTLCHLDIAPASPSVSSTGNVSCYPNEAVQIAVVASAADGGTLSYQWYFNQSGTGDYGYELAGATQPTCAVSTASLGLTYYYCVVTNTNNGLSASVSSPVIAVDVQEKGLASVSIETLPVKTTYLPGERVDLTGLQLAVSYADGTSQLVTEGFSAYPEQLDALGDQTVQITYQGHVCFFNAFVQEQQETVSGIGVLTLPSKIRYTVGEPLDTAGLSIRAYTNLGGYRDVSSGFSCWPTVFDTLGTQTVTVYYEDQVCTFDVTVEEAEHPVSLAVETMPNKTTYTVGESLNITGLVLRQISSRQNVQYVYSGFTCTPIQLNTVGRQEITVSYGGLSTRFTVTVAEVRPTVAPTVVPVALPAETPAPSPAPTTVPADAPTAVLPVVTASPPPASAAVTRTAHSAHQSNLARSLVGVVVSAAVLALAVLGAYVFVLNKGGLVAAVKSLKKPASQGGAHQKKK